MSTKSGWVSSEYMSTIYGVTNVHLHNFKASDKEARFTKKEGSNVFFNVKLLEKIKSNKEHHRIVAQDMYYEVKEKFNMRDTDMARSLLSYGYGETVASWRVFLSRGMWRIPDDSLTILSTKSSTLSKNFVAWASYILQDDNIEDFDSIEEYYDYHEAKKLLKGVESETNRSNKNIG